MSPLLPRHYYIGLNGGGWIAQRRWGRGNHVVPLASSPITDSSTQAALADSWQAVRAKLLAILETLPRPRGSTASIMLPDDLGQVCTLPWQAGVVTTQEVARYGRYHLASRGLAVEHGWHVQAQLPQFERPGLVYALQDTLLEQFKVDLASLNLRLRHVAPVAAIDYARRSYGWGRKPQVRLHLGSHSVAALSFDRGGLHNYLHEVGGHTLPATITRLLRRLQLNEDEVLSQTPLTLVTPTPALFMHLTEAATEYGRLISVEDLRDWSHW